MVRFRSIIPRGTLEYALCLWDDHFVYEALRRRSVLRPQVITFFAINISRVLVYDDPTFGPFYQSGNYRTGYSSFRGSHYHRNSNHVSPPQYIGPQPILT